MSEPEPFQLDGPGPPGKDGTPSWAYDEDGYCVCCGNGHWKYHMPGCVLRDALEASAELARVRQALVVATRSVESRSNELREARTRMFWAGINDNPG